MYIYIYILYTYISIFCFFCSWFEGCPILGAPWKVELVVPHTPCLSCVGAFTQLRRWAPRLQVAVVYQDWLLREKGEVTSHEDCFFGHHMTSLQMSSGDHSACSPHEFCSKVWVALKDWRDWRKLLRESVAQRWWMPRRHTVSILGMNINKARTTRMFWHFTYFSKISHSCSFTFTMFQG